MSEGGVPCIMLPVPMLGIVFGRLGITVDTPVIIYTTNPSDSLSASYVGWSLAVSGNDHFALLDGDLRKWVEEDRPLTRRYADMSEALLSGGIQRSHLCRLDVCAGKVARRRHLLVDSRIRARYTGDMGSTQRRGHIPGAILHNYLWDFSANGIFLSLDLLRDHYVRDGITPEKEIITYCVTGREASAVWFVLKYLLGYPRVRLYQASLTEWSANPELPMVTGDTPWGEKGKKAA